MRNNNTYMAPYRVNAGRPAKAHTTRDIDHTGKKFGCLTAIDRIRERDGRYYWSCICDCGGPESQIIVRSDKLTGGQTKSCKCGRGYERSGTKKQAERKAPPPDRQWPAEIPTAPERPKAAPALGLRLLTDEERTAAELLSARQMVAFRFAWSDIAAYLAIGRAGGCTIPEAKQLLAA